MLPEPILFGYVHMYGVMISVGLIAAFAVLQFYGKKALLDTKTLDFLFYDAVAAIIFGFGAASLFQSLYEYLEHPEKGFRFGSGITFIGGLIGGAALFLAVFAVRRKKLPDSLSKCLPVIACCITVAHGFGRIGCFFAGCCYGKPTDSFLGVLFPGHTQPVYPTQLFEAAFLFLLFGVLSYMLLKRRSPYGFAVYLCAYGIFRFCIEFIRDDERGSFIVKWLSPSQFWSVIMLLIGIFCFVYAKRQKNLPIPAEPAASEPAVSAASAAPASAGDEKEYAEPAAPEAEKNTNK